MYMEKKEGHKIQLEQWRTECTLMPSTGETEITQWKSTEASLRPSSLERKASKMAVRQRKRSHTQAGKVYQLL